MDLTDRLSCHRAVQARDARFDGRFFVGVTSTGIYCRPICPARTPKLENCRFYPSAAAAQQAGFRPCLRCRPESAPGGGAWRGSSDTVACALALLAECDQQEEPVLAAVAARLDVSLRQLRRLFQQHLGASPVAVLQTRRILVAKQLIHETSLPMTAVAMAAGFGSIRRFNETFQAMYGRPPSALRRRAGSAADSAGEIVLRLRYRPPYDWPALLAALPVLPGVALAIDGEYRRTVRVGTVRVWQEPARHNLHVGLRLDDIRRLPDMLARVARTFDTAADSAVIDAHLAADPLLAPLVTARPGLRVPGPWEPFEAAVLALLPPAALPDLLARCADPLLPALHLPGLTRLSPSPAGVAAADLAGLAGLADHADRLQALQSLARAVERDPALLQPGSAPLAARLAALPGMGTSLAQHIAAAIGSDGDTDTGTPPDRGEAWQPWRAYAQHHLSLTKEIA
ncbi:bifunctional transcriptional activator/DNA repair enzyme AdaA [Pseudoduganella armeniaca]|uniref:3-methyladenine DNA glycosylase 2 n=1 Tax=Pseudoduganella armeniaca TaxID=2072590 RepID=A0A2R4C9A1_9BURK|nr:Ada metal-binding domain-containing protein [Pseudoduganella armeniaca]AVR96155.1 3-methyladenine DNA glycosylase 2 [Pseudoduganella armeniaca]